MPQFSGVDIIQTLKNEGIFESRNIVIFTASSNSKLLEELRNNGAKEIFKKPCSLDDLKALIERYRTNAQVLIQNTSIVNERKSIGLGYEETPCKTKKESRPTR